jgi:transposase
LIPNLLLRMLLVGYLCGLTGERKLVAELGMHLACRWFTGLGFDQQIPHHSTFSKLCRRRAGDARRISHEYNACVFWRQI